MFFNSVLTEIPLLITANPALLDLLTQQQWGKFVIINNTTGSSENDTFFINIANVSGIDNMEDVDGMSKINVMFTDNSVLTIEYFDTDKMNTDYELLSNAFTAEYQPASN